MNFALPPSIALYYSTASNLPNDLINEGFNIGTYFGKLACNLILENSKNCPLTTSIIEGSLQQKKSNEFFYAKSKEEKIINSDILLFLPGGLETLEDLLFCFNYNKNLNLKKTIIIYNFSNFYENLLNWFEEVSLINIINSSSDLFCICQNLHEINYFFNEE
ncbi:LOG family protein [Pigmentibacter sp. JX0631]|uniref:LOG family protein n=1 Tax=Pigmentibacter sp. JX0631 TaxID=2976982 RepID=UPI002469AE43|nr:LOG family protein [Pigmentibacter sp. JX0631]WGL60576.1 LOG family protein [Pigmentibacter sp. JX0631]